MRLIDARTQKTCQIPLQLGEAGRGRWLELVEVARQPDRQPESGEAVGYFLVPAGEKRPPGAPERHVVLTRPRPGQTGVLVRLYTEGAYTRGSSGHVALLHGDAECLTHGHGARGAAGRIGSWDDELWHCRGEALFRVVLEGGTSKGYGARYCVVTAHGRVTWWNPEALRVALATGADAHVEAVCRAAVAAGVAPELIEHALAALDLVEAEDAQAAPAPHYGPEDLRAALEDVGIAVPATWREAEGVAEIRDRVLVPGTRSLVFVHCTPGGGKRWSYRGPSARGLDILHVRAGTWVLAVRDDDWALSWTQLRDGEEHTLGHDDASVYTSPWPGHEEPPRGNYVALCALDESLPPLEARQ